MAETKIIEDGDTLLLRCSTPMSAQVAHELKERVMSLLPHLADVFILSGVDEIALMKAETHG